MYIVCIHVQRLQITLVYRWMATWKGGQSISCRNQVPNLTARSKLFRSCLLAITEMLFFTKHSQEYEYGLLLETIKCVFSIFVLGRFEWLCTELAACVITGICLDFASLGMLCWAKLTSEYIGELWFGTCCLDFCPFWLLMCSDVNSLLWDWDFTYSGGYCQGLQENK